MESMASKASRGCHAHRPLTRHVHRGDGSGVSVPAVLEAGEVGETRARRRCWRCYLDATKAVRDEEYAEAHGVKEAAFRRTPSARG